MRRNYQKEESYSHGLLIERFIRLDKRFLPDKSSIISCDKDFWISQDNPVLYLFQVVLENPSCQHVAHKIWQRATC